VSCGLLGWAGLGWVGLSQLVDWSVGFLEEVPMVRIVMLSLNKNDCAYIEEKTFFYCRHVIVFGRVGMRRTSSQCGLKLYYFHSPYNIEHHK